MLLINALTLRHESFLQQLFATDRNTIKIAFFLIAGPCVVESEELVFEVAEKVSAICKKLGIPLCFKSSYKKANRTSANSFTGLGDNTGLEIIQKAANNFNLPTVTDIHSEQEARDGSQLMLIFYRYLLFYAGKPNC